ncbi:MAG: hypothetical protein KGK17_06575 [Betaproteobacteria bacterium]|nr:hypothetical protein [Betaproteobacteria bacterium]
MNEQNTQMLYQDFPALYRDAGKSMKETCMCWGFSCGDGWYPLVYQLSAQIEVEAQRLGLDPQTEAWPRALQVKEKFGTLRFYVSMDDSSEHRYTLEQFGQMKSLRPVAGIESVQALISEAEEKSATICEHCGAPGTFRQGGWCRTLCEDCETKYQMDRR